MTILNFRADGKNQAGEFIPNPETLAKVGPKQVSLFLTLKHLLKWGLSFQ